MYYRRIVERCWHRGQFPHVYYYRNKDGKEIDLLFQYDRTFYPVEIKKSVTPKREWAKTFSVLQGLGQETGDGAVVCLCRESLPLDNKVSAMPVGLL